MADRSFAIKRLMSTFDDPNRVHRAVKLYEKKYNVQQRKYNVNILGEIVTRLQEKDSKRKRKPLPKMQLSLHQRSLTDPSSPKAASIHSHRATDAKRKSRGKPRSRTNAVRNDEVNVDLQRMLTTHTSTDELFGPPPNDANYAPHTNNHQMYRPEQRKSDPFLPHMSMQHAPFLSIDDDIDYRRGDGKFVGAKIYDIRGTNLFLHYHGQTKANAFRSDYTKDLPRIARFRSISGRCSMHKLSVGDKVQINAYFSNNQYQWMDGQIVRMDKASGQVQVEYLNTRTQKTQYFWTHLDNHFEIQFTQQLPQFITNNRPSIQLFNASLAAMELDWRLDTSASNMAGYNPKNSLFACIAKEMYDDYKLINRVKDEFYEYTQENTNYTQMSYKMQRAKSKKTEVMLEPDDRVNIELLCELYNVRIKVYEPLRGHKEQLVVSLIAGSYHNTQHLPLIALAIPHKYEFFVINTPNCMHSRPLKNQSDRNGAYIRDLRLLQTNQVYQFYHQLFRYYDRNNVGLVNIRRYQISRFLETSQIDSGTLHHICNVIVGHGQKQKDQNNSALFVNLEQFISIMNLIFIVQSSGDRKQLPPQYALLLTDMSLDSVYKVNAKQPFCNLPFMQYPIKHPWIASNHMLFSALPSDINAFSDQELDDDAKSDEVEPPHGLLRPLQLDLSSTELTPVPPYDSDVSEGQLDANEAPEPNMSWKQYEFKRFFEETMKSPKNHLYYQSFVRAGYDNIDLMIYLDEKTLIAVCKIDRIFSKMLMAKISDFKKSYLRFQSFIVDELKMEEYWECFCNAGVVTFSILYHRVQRHQDIARIIGDAVDAKIIYQKLPKMQRRRTSPLPADEQCGLLSPDTSDYIDR